MGELYLDPDGPEVEELSAADLAASGGAESLEVALELRKKEAGKMHILLNDAAFLMNIVPWCVSDIEEHDGVTYEVHSYWGQTAPGDAEPGDRYIASVGESVDDGRYFVRHTAFGPELPGLLNVLPEPELTDEFFISFERPTPDIQRKITAKGGLGPQGWEMVPAPDQDSDAALPPLHADSLYYIMSVNVYLERLRDTVRTLLVDNSN